MIFSRINGNKYSKKRLIWRPGFVCLLLLLLSIASLIAEQVQVRFLERLEKQIYKDQVATSKQELLFVVSSAEHDSNEVDVFVTIAVPDYTNAIEEVSSTPAETKETIRANEFLGSTGLVRAYRHNRAVDLHDSQSNEFILSQFSNNLETELRDDLELTPEETFGLTVLLKTLTNDYKPDLQ